MFKRLKTNLFRISQKNKKNNKIHSNQVSSNVSLGKNNIIMENTFIDANSKIGNNTYIGLNNFITRAEIGNYCSIANNVSIGSGEHNINKISTSSMFYKDPYNTLTKEDCIIGNDVWIGVDSIILRGVTIGNGAVIGANSVVTRDVPPFSIVVGSPAKVIKYRFSNDVINKIVLSDWWEYDFEDARTIIEKLEVEIND